MINSNNRLSNNANASPETLTAIINNSPPLRQSTQRFDGRVHSQIPLANPQVGCVPPPECIANDRSRFETMAEALQNLVVLEMQVQRAHREAQRPLPAVFEQLPRRSSPQRQAIPQPPRPVQTTMPGAPTTRSGNLCPSTVTRKSICITTAVVGGILGVSLATRYMALAMANGYSSS